MVKPYEPLYTVSEAAKVLKMNLGGVYELINTGKLPALTLGRKKIRGTDLERFIMTLPTDPHGEGGESIGKESQKTDR